jgi:hypothetical protein
MWNVEAAKFRQLAEECRQRAEKTISPIDEKEWLRMAEEWDKLALSAERREY